MGLIITKNRIFGQFWPLSIFKHIIIGLNTILLDINSGTVGALFGTDLTKIGLLDNKLFILSPIDVERLLTNFFHRQKEFQQILTVLMSNPHSHTVENAM